MAGIKTPTSSDWGHSTVLTPFPATASAEGASLTAPLPSKGFVRQSESQAGVLARGIILLSAPSQGRSPQWSPQISFRLQLQGSAGFAPASHSQVSHVSP